MHTCASTHTHTMPRSTAEEVSHMDIMFNVVCHEMSTRGRSLYEIDLN